MASDPATFHPITDLFPEMSHEQFISLKADIEKVGQLEPIWRLPDGRIVDGRHRFRACTELGIEPTFIDAPDMEEEEMLMIVVALNLKRRHLNDSQRAMVAARLKPLYERAAQDRMMAGKAVDGEDTDGQDPSVNSRQGQKPVKGKSAAQAAQTTNVSTRSVETAAKVIDQGIPELLKAVEDGNIAVSDAVHAANLPPEDQREAMQLVLQGDAKNIKAALKALRLEKQVAKVKATPPPEGTYNVIVADPPWSYDKNRKGDPTQRGVTPYPPMSVEEICALPVPAAKDCILWLWVTNAHLADGTAAKVLDAWGFTGKTILTWGKTKMGLGDWLRGKTEHCILAVKGKPTHKPPGKYTTLMEAPVGEHSVKPDAFYTIVNKLCPGKKVEMFSRQPRKGWDSWGAETEGATK